MTRNTFSDTASIGEDFIKHYGVKGMKWGVRKKDKEPKREYNKVVRTNEDGSQEIYVGGVGTAGRLLDDEEQKRADELAELMPQVDSDYEEAKSEYEKLYTEYERLDGVSKTLSENDPKYDAAVSKAWDAWERSAEVRKKRDKLSMQRIEVRTELSELQSKAMALEQEERKKNPGSARRAVVTPEPGKTTYTSRPSNAKPGAKFRGDHPYFDKDRRARHFDDSEYLEHYGVKMEDVLDHSDVSELGSDFIQHYGIKGMKWGVRKDRKSSNSKTTPKVRSFEERYERIRTLNREDQTKLSYHTSVLKRAKTKGYSDGLNGKPIQFLVENDPDGVDFLNSVADELGMKELGKRKARKFRHSDDGDYSEEYLEHYGVKGMKWGVRKDGKPQGYQGGSSSGKRKKKRKNNLAKRRLERAKSKLERQRIKERASEYEKSTEESKRKVRENEKAASADSKPKSDPKPKPKSKSVRELSDDDLNKIIRRIELEKRYSTLMEEQRPKSTTEKVNKVLKKAATEAATNVTKQLMTNAMKAAVTRATGVALPEEKKKK